MINQVTKQKMYLTAESIYRFLLEQDDKLDTLILCKSSEVNLMTTDQSMYEALGSIEDKSKINFNKLVKLMEVTELLPFTQAMKKPRQILTNQRADAIRNFKTAKEKEAIAKIEQKEEIKSDAKPETKAEKKPKESKQAKEKKQDKK